ILAPTWSVDVKNKLNIFVKKREWYQPFCPSLIAEDAKEIFEDFDGSYDKFMTMGYMSKNEIRDKILSVIHTDGSARPQMVGSENERYRILISQIKKNIGLGIVLNTSFNIHGDPIVCSPKDAIETQIKTKTKYMFLEDYFIQLK
ncbi:MAG: carbamoyltransferase C-terminal domain-containing protein, partial [Fervidobacterium sp.]